jgi:hypothetical protein
MGEAVAASLTGARAADLDCRGVALKLREMIVALILAFRVFTPDLFARHFVHQDMEIRWR